MGCLDAPLDFLNSLHVTIGVQELSKSAGFFSLVTLLAISIACSSAADIQEAAQLGTVDVGGVPISDEVLSSFKFVQGGTMTVGASPDSSFFSSLDPDESFLLENMGDFDLDGDELTDSSVFSSDDVEYAQEESNDDLDDVVEINSLQVMDTEVTVRMFTDFLNRLTILQNSTTDSGESFSDPDDIHKPAMALGTCGILKVDPISGLVKEEALELSGLEQEDTVADETDVSSKPTFTSPHRELKKARFSGESDFRYSVSANRRDFPVVYVSQKEAKEFCRWLGAGYRLPTWQEWQYAAYGGNPEANFSTSTGKIFREDDSGNIEEPLVYLANLRGANVNKTLEVRSMPSAKNGFGLYDMAGNVYEWTYFREEDVTNATNIPYDGLKFALGGSFNTARFAHASNWYRPYQVMLSEDAWAEDLGFRVVRSVGSSGRSVGDLYNEEITDPDL